MIALAGLALLVAAVVYAAGLRRLEIALAHEQRAARHLADAVAALDRADRLASANAARYGRIADTVSTN